LSFLIAVLGRGDRQVAIQVLSRHADHLKQPARCLNSCYHPPPYVSDEAKAGAVVTECQILAMQFVFIRPLTSILAFVYNTIYDSNRSSYASDQDFSDTAKAYFKSPPFFLAMITNVSVFLAFTGLLKFYHAVRDDLKWCQPFSKFMTIKGIVFLTFWQGLLISIVVSSLDRNQQYDGNVKSVQHTPTSSSSSGTTHSGSTNGTSGMWGSPSHSPASHNSTHDVRFLYSSPTSSSSHVYTTAFEEAAQIQNFLICLEMLFFSIAHYCVFPAEEWEPGYRPQSVAKPGIGLKDFVSDMSYIISSKRRQNKGCVAVPSFEEDDLEGDSDVGAYNQSRRSGRKGGLDDVQDDDDEDDETDRSDETPGFPDPLDPDGDLRRRRSRKSSDGSSSHDGPLADGDAALMKAKSSQEIV
jgi:Organic solute transporter Ostalpha